MKGKSFYWAIFSFIFSIVGLFAQIISIGTGKDIISICILAFIYITPLLIDAIEDVVKVDAYNYHQYRLDKTALMVGIAYFLFVLFLFVLHSGNIVLQLSGWWDKGVKFILAVCPAVYVARSFYGFLIKWNQNANTAKAYFQNNDIKYKA